LFVIHTVASTISATLTIALSLAGIKRVKHAFNAGSGCGSGKKLKGTLAGRGSSYHAKGKNDGENGRRKLHCDLVGNEIFGHLKIDFEGSGLYPAGASNTS